MKELNCLGQRALETLKENPSHVCFSYNISYPLSSVEELSRRFVKFQAFSITVTPYAVYFRSISVIFVLVFFTSPLTIVWLI